jgi:hypothetical protein
MALITDKPKDVPTTNALDGLPDDLLGPVPARIEMSGKTLLILDNPPDPGEYLKVEITLRCKDEGKELLDNGELVHYRKTKFIAAKITAAPYKPEPEADGEPDPSLFDQPADPA